MQREEWLTPDFGYALRHLRWIASRRSAFQQVDIFESPTFGRVLRLDGAMQCSERDEFFYHEPLVHMALAHARSRQRVLIIGGGDGGAAEEALKWRDVERVDHVEIDDTVIALCREHLRAVHRGVLDGVNPRYALHTEDGMRFLASGEGRAPYDAIILDLTDAGGPSAALYEAPFYDQCARTLRPDGVLTLHVAAPWTQTAACRRTLDGLRRAFRVVRPYVVSVPMSGGQWLMAMAGNDLRLAEGQDAQPACLRGLAGPPLQVVSAAQLKAMLVLPPYVQNWTQAPP